MKKIILFNGPPGSGKDFGAEYVAKSFPNTILDKFANVLKERTHAMYGFPWKKASYYEDCKNEAHEDFYGLSPRQAYINVSETYFKPIHGIDIFGKILASELDKREWDLAVISDSGFVDEALVLIEKYGAENIILVRVHRKGHDFSNDSRSYIHLNVCNIDIENEGDSSYTDQLHDLVDSIINNRPSEATPAAVDIPSTIGPSIYPIKQEHDMWSEASQLTSIPLIESVPGQPCTKTFEQTRLDIEDANAKPAVLAEFIPNIQNIKYDENDTKKDYVFEDVINGKPSLWTRVKRMFKAL